MLFQREIHNLLGNIWHLECEEIIKVRVPCPRNTGKLGIGTIVERGMFQGFHPETCSRPRPLCRSVLPLGVSMAPSARPHQQGVTKNQ